MKNRTLLVKVLPIVLGCVMVFTSCHGTDPDNPHRGSLPTNELVDASVNPGDDFYNYCNGTWIKNHPLQPGESTRQFWIDSQYAEEAFQQVLLSSNDPVVSKLMRDVDTRNLTEADLTALQQKTRQQLEEIDQLASLEAVIGRVATLGMKGYVTGIRLYSEPVERRIQTVAEVIMPTAAPAEQWQRMTGCAEAEAKQKADACTAILDAWTPNVGIAIRTVPYAGNEVVEARRLLAKAIDVPVERLIYGETIDQDEFMKTYVTDAHIDDWKLILQNAIVSYNYRWTYATREEVAAYLTEPLHPLAYRITKLYSEAYGQQIMRDFVYQMVEEIRASFIEMIETNNWLTETTKSAALDKAHKMESFVGYPDTWQQERLGSVPTGKTLLEDMEQLGEEWSNLINSSRTDSPTRDDIWYSLSQAAVAPYNLNAMNMTEMNGLYMFMPMLLPNVSRQDVPDSYNYAMVGAVAGHEFGHGFDTAGYRFGSMGEWLNWWAPQDEKEFTRRAKMLADYNSQYVPFPDKMPGLHSNGDQTTVEDIADLNGLNTAFRAMVKHYRAKGVSDAELLKAKQEFFLAYGNLWAGSFSEEYVIRRINTNIHSVGPLRINGVVRHMDEWYEAYDVKPSDALYLAPDARVRVWNN